MKALNKIHLIYFLALIFATSPALAQGQNLFLTVGENSRQPACITKIAIHRLVEASEDSIHAYRARALELLGTGECVLLPSGQRMEVLMIEGPASTVTYYDGRSIEMMYIETRWFYDDMKNSLAAGEDVR